MSVTEIDDGSPSNGPSPTHPCAEAACGGSQSELERTVRYLERLVVCRRKQIVWTLLLLVALWVLIAVKEVTSLLLLAYVLALLINPIIIRLGRYGLSRSISVVLVCATVVGAIALFFAIAVPLIVQQYGDLATQLPGYLKQLVMSADETLRHWTGSRFSLDGNKLWDDVSSYGSVLDEGHLRAAAATLGATLLQGYSVTLTILNFVLFPFFLYYIACDLPSFHSAFIRLLPIHWRTPLRETGGEILEHLYAFVRGQLTVSSILILLYIFGLLLIGLPSAVLIGFLAGALSVVPYLGVLTGVILSLLVTLIADPGWWPIAKIAMVFVTVQTLEGSVLTPRIVGESLGLHPLLVMLAVVVSSQLLGLLGLVIAVPLAATLRVVVRNILKSMAVRADDPSGVIVCASQ